MPSPRAGAALLTSGLYRRVRHPVYSGLLVWAFGMAIAAASGLHFMLFGLLWAFFHAKAAHEERLLAQKFSGYSEYAARTPRFFPALIQTR
jgi:protein-S-isoprenylcysteine O-methyltransferase Ste14